MFCPNCKSEYRAGFSRCSDCGAQLVEQLEAPVSTNRPRSADGPELLWTGTTPAVRGVILSALDDADIPHHENTREVGPIPGLSQPVYAIFIPARHHNAARAAMEKAVRELENGAQQPSDPLSPAFPEHGEELLGPASDDIPEDYEPREATAEVWSGTDTDTKDMLIASLRENGIGCELDAEASFRIRVMPSSERRAREIIREVTEATPPQ
jgi:hypothetical protein